MSPRLPGVSILSPEATGAQYRRWRRGIQAAFMAKRTWGHCDGSNPMPMPTRVPSTYNANSSTSPEPQPGLLEERRAWVKKDRDVKLDLFLSVSDDIKMEVFEVGPPLPPSAMTAKEMLEALDREFDVFHFEDYHHVFCHFLNLHIDQFASLEEFNSEFLATLEDLTDHGFPLHNAQACSAYFSKLRCTQNPWVAKKLKEWDTLPSEPLLTELLKEVPPWVIIRPLAYKAPSHTGSESSAEENAGSPADSDDAATISSNSSQEITVHASVEDLTQTYKFATGGVTTKRISTKANLAKMAQSIGLSSSNIKPLNSAPTSRKTPTPPPTSSPAEAAPFSPPLKPTVYTPPTKSSSRFNSSMQQKKSNIAPSHKKSSSSSSDSSTQTHKKNISSSSVTILTASPTTITTAPKPTLKLPSHPSSRPPTPSGPTSRASSRQSSLEAPKVSARSRSASPSYRPTTPTHLPVNDISSLPPALPPPSTPLPDIPSTPEPSWNMRTPSSGKSGRPATANPQSTPPQHLSSEAFSSSYPAALKPTTLMRQDSSNSSCMSLPLQGVPESAMGDQGIMVGSRGMTVSRPMSANPGAAASQGAGPYMHSHSHSRSGSGTKEPIGLGLGIGRGSWESEKNGSGSGGIKTGDSFVVAVNKDRESGDKWLNPSDRKRSWSIKSMMIGRKLEVREII